ncbi:MAG: histidine kinase N-terminal 7TM domain-containing protein [Chloroflexota bacterium]|nr:hypothetical protein [Dehalococcoidia bacterium]MDW8252529.1 histidine kinase N-terminal 7TM domain-containing protein [Chloroflexota bacterium]
MGNGISRRSMTLLVALALLLVFNPEEVVLGRIEVRALEGVSELVYERGPAELAGILYSLSGGLVPKAVTRAPAPYRWQTAPLLIGIVFPWFLHALQVSGLLRSPTLAPTTPGITVASVAFL